MNNFDISYQKLLQEILNNGVLKAPARTNLPSTYSLFGTRLEHNMEEGFPLLTTKSMRWRSIVHELLWFLKGDTNIKYLVDNHVNIWNKDAYRWYLKICKEVGVKSVSLGDFVDFIRREDDLEEISKLHFGGYPYVLGDLGKVYGYQWRNQNGIDQIKFALQKLKNEPLGRYAIIDAWNPADFNDMALPPCHLLYQFNCRAINDKEKMKWVIENTNVDLENALIVERASQEDVPKYFLDLQMYQRSCDVFLGVPYNLASMGLLLMLFSKILNYIPGNIIWVGGDTHLYENHINVAAIQINRQPLFSLPKMELIFTEEELKEMREDFSFQNISIKNFDLKEYFSHPELKAVLSVGL